MDLLIRSWASLIAQWVKNPPAMQEIPGSGRSAGEGDRLPTPVFLGFLWSSAGKESVCNTEDLGSIPGYIDAYYLTLLKAHKRKQQENREVSFLKFLSMDPPLLNHFHLSSSLSIYIFQAICPMCCQEPFGDTVYKESENKLKVSGAELLNYAPSAVL